MPARNTRGAMSDLHKSAGAIAPARLNANDNENQSHLKSEMRMIMIRI